MTMEDTAYSDVRETSNTAEDVEGVSGNPLGAGMTNVETRMTSE